jgi:hypothetical protein
VRPSSGCLKSSTPSMVGWIPSAAKASASSPSGESVEASSVVLLSGESEVGVVSAVAGVGETVSGVEEGLEACRAPRLFPLALFFS